MVNVLNYSLFTVFFCCFLISKILTQDLLDVSEIEDEISDIIFQYKKNKLVKEKNIGHIGHKKFDISNVNLKFIHPKKRTRFLNDNWGKCFTKCPINQFIDKENNCVDNCEEPKIIVDEKCNGEEVIEIEDGFSTEHCVDSCQDINNGTLPYYDGVLRECVLECRGGTILVDNICQVNNECRGTLDDDGTCICPPNYYGKYCDLTMNNLTELVEVILSADKANISDSTSIKGLEDVSTIIKENIHNNFKIDCFVNNDTIHSFSTLCNKVDEMKPYNEKENMNLLAIFEFCILMSKLTEYRQQYVKELSPFPSYDEIIGKIKKESLELELNNENQYSNSSNAKIVTVSITPINQDLSNRRFYFKPYGKLKSKSNLVSFLKIDTNSLDKNNIPLSSSNELYINIQNLRNLGEEGEEEVEYYDIGFDNLNTIFKEEEIATYKTIYKKGINSLDKNIPFYTDKCYRCEEFDYDLHYDYRRKFIYPGMQIVPYKNSVDQFKFIGLDPTETMPVIRINSGLEGDYIVYTTEESELETPDDHKKSVFAACLGKQKNLGKNIAFIFYLIVFILGLLLIIYFCFIENKRTIPAGYENGTQIEMNDLSSSRANNNGNSSRSFVRSHADLKKNDMSMMNNQRGPNNIEGNQNLMRCSDRIKYNFKTLYPVVFLFFKNSPYPKHLWCLYVFFNICIIFGYNGVLYTNSLLEERIKHDDRNNFAYPMKREFGKIICSIVLVAVTNVVLRFILLPRYGNANRNNSARRKRYSDTEMNTETKIKIKLAVSYIIMLILSVFFFMYSVVFCDVFIHAKNCWFYSGLWTTMLIIFGFAPFYILVLSIFDSGRHDECMFYFKELFLF